MFGGKDSREQDPAAQHDARQGSLFPNDPPYRPDEGLKLHHYFIGGVLIAAMLGVLITGYFYSRSLVIKEPKEETVAAAPSAPPATAAPAEPPAPAPKAAAPVPPQPAPSAEKAAPKPEAVAEKEPQKAKPEAIPAAEKPVRKPEAAAEKKTPSPKAESAPKAAPGTEVYFIQLAAFKDPRQTAQLCKQIEPLGFQCYFGNTDTADGRYWRLRVGPYAAKDKAESDLATLQGKGFDGRLIPLKKSGVKAPLQLPL